MYWDLSRTLSQTSNLDKSLIYKSILKTTTGRKPTALYFKVNLLGKDNGYNVSHDLLIKIEYKDESGYI
jgi:hypothetical protein